MSLINEALKKAQRQRHDTAAPVGAPPGDVGGVAQRPPAKTAQSTLLIVAGAALLVVASIVGTAMWVTRTPHASTVAAVSKPEPVVSKPVEPAGPPAVTFSTPAPAVAPASNSRGESSAATESARKADALTVASIKSPATKPANAAPSSPVPAVQPSNEPVARESVAAAPSNVATSSPASPVPAAASVVANEDVPAAAPAKNAPAASAKPDERVLKFIDNVKVAGVRTSGSESKVLMNDRVYRLNDMVDRSLGLRLTQVSREHLTFTDANGVTYVKDL